MSELTKHVIIKINKEFSYPVSMLEANNLMESALTLATDELNESFTVNSSLNEVFDVKIEKPLCYKTKEVFKNKLEQQIFDYLFEQELLEEWETTEISFDNTSYLYWKINEEYVLKPEISNRLETFTKKVLKTLQKIKKRD